MSHVALIGNPNVGKSTIFNFLCKRSENISNFPGTTVDKKIAKLQSQKNLYIIDLPGVYGINPISETENTIIKILTGVEKNTPKPNLIIFFIDSCNIKRGLYLLSQVVEFDIPIVVVLTMTDLSQKYNIKIDIEKLQNLLNLPVISISYKNKKNLENLKNFILKEANSKIKKSSNKKIGIVLPKSFENIQKNIQKIAKPHFLLNDFTTSCLLFFENNIIWDSIKKIKNIYSKIFETKNNFYQSNNKNRVTLNDITILRHQWSYNIIQQIQKQKNSNYHKVQDKIDNIITNPFSGTILFIGVFFSLFYLIYSLVQPAIDFIEAIFIKITIFNTKFLNENSILESLINDGIIAGVGSVVIFLPQIALLYFFITVLEQTGYLARVTFLVDKIFSSIGLNGSSFIPLLSSFACAVPGIKQSRIIEGKNTRLITILIAPLMSCSARLPIYLLFISTFIQPIYGTFWAIISLVFMHTIGPLIGFGIAAILNKKIFTKDPGSFIQELPIYRFPILKVCFLKTYKASKSFVKKAGGIILVFSILIWTISYFPNYNITNTQTTIQLSQENNLQQKQLENSYISKIGKAIAPIFEPLGYDWKITVAILASFPARELLISTLGVLYGLEEADEKSPTLKDKLKNAKNEKGEKIYSPLIAFSIMIFFALCSQCFSTLVIIKNELNSIKWPIFVFFYMTLLAYFFAYIVYKIFS